MIGIFLSTSDLEEDGIGWIEADDTFNNIEQDRDIVNFESRTIFYNSPDVNDIFKEIEINSNRVRTHISEDRLNYNAVTETYEWYKVNLPEYGIENKWIRSTQENSNSVDRKYHDIKFSIENKNQIHFTYYDNPETLLNPVFNDKISGKKIEVEAGYKWLDDTIGYEWYKISIPELDIHNKWINYRTFSELRNTQLYGLMDNVSSRMVESSQVHELQQEINNYRGAFFSKGFVKYRFEQPVDVKQLLIDLPNESDYNGLVVEFFDKDNKKIDDLKVNISMKSKKHFYLKNTLKNVHYFKVKNESSSLIYMNNFELYGDFVNAANNPKDIEFSILNDTVEEFFAYDEPDAKLNKRKFTGVKNKTINITSGYYLNNYIEGYQWYKISIPELNIFDVWITYDTFPNLKSIHNYGLMDNVSGQIIENVNTSSIDDNSLNCSCGKSIFSGGHFLYEFSKEVDVSKIFVKDHILLKGSRKTLILELLDSNKNVLITKDIDENSFFEQFIELEQKIENVKYYRLTYKDLDPFYKNLTFFELYN